MKKEYSEETCLCALNRIFGFRPDIGHGIVESLGSASEVFRLGEAGLAEHLGPFSKIAPLINEHELEQSEAELARLKDRGIRFITIQDDGYPELLLECEDAPLGLYYRSDSAPEEVFNIRKQIAVVGTRDISPYGKEWCRKIVGAMARSEHKPLIVSGFALGTDIIAHLTAIEAGLPTVAVLPTGIDDIYPPHHRKYVDVMASTPGCAFVTDYPPGTVPKAINFLRRNRIIAGICSGTILVESKLKGGGMMTARLAASYNRDLMVLPGRVDDPRSQGCNQLLQEKLAEPLTDGETFLLNLGLGNAAKSMKKNLASEIEAIFKDELTESELLEMQTIAKMILKNRAISLDELCARCGMSFSKVSRHTGMLESEGVISVDILQRCSIVTKVI